MSNLQIAHDILTRAEDAQDAYLAECARACIRAFKWRYTPPWREWAMVKAFWEMTQEVDA